MKIRPVGAELFPCAQMHGLTDGHDEAYSPFWQSRVRASNLGTKLVTSTIYQNC